MIVGVNTHFGFGGTRTNADHFRAWNAEARLTSSRDNMFWSHVESEGPGILNLRQEPRNTQTVWNSMASTVEPLLVLGQSNRYYDSGGQPKSDAAVAGFTRYADWVVSQTPLVQMVEVWNEWNINAGVSLSGGSQGDPVDYARLATATTRVLKASHPEVKVLVGSIANDDWAWTSAAIQAGMLENADGVAVHLYNHCASPQNVGADRAIAKAEELRRLIDNAGKPGLPIYVTEFGWPNNINGACPTTEQDTAVHTARFLLEASLRDWLAGVWFHEYQDGGTDLTDREQNYGLMRYDLTEKPSGCAVRQLAATIAQRPKSVARVSGVTMARFANGTTDRWIVWASQSTVYSVGNAQVQLAAQSGSALPPPTTVCTVTGGTLSATTATLSGKNLFVIDLPASETITMLPLN